MNWMTELLKGMRSYSVNVEQLICLLWTIQTCTQTCWTLVDYIDMTVILLV